MDSFPSPASQAVTLKDLNADGIPTALSGPAAWDNGQQKGLLVLGPGQPLFPSEAGCPPPRLKDSVLLLVSWTPPLLPLCS